MTADTLDAADELDRLDVPTDVVVITSYDRLWRACQGSRGLLEPVQSRSSDETILARLFPTERRAPLVTLIDGHPHTLAFLGAFVGVPVSCLGVSGFGQGGMVEQVHAHHRIDARAVVEAALDLTDR